MIFDLLSLDREDLMCAPYAEQRTQLEEPGLNGVYWQTPERVRARARRRGCEAERELLPARGGGLGEDQEPRVLAVGNERERAIKKPRVKQFV